MGLQHQSTELTPKDYATVLGVLVYLLSLVGVLFH